MAERPESWRHTAPHISIGLKMSGTPIFINVNERLGETKTPRVPRKKRKGEKRPVSEGPAESSSSLVNALDALHVRVKHRSGVVGDRVPHPHALNLVLRKPPRRAAAARAGGGGGVVGGGWGKDDEVSFES